MNVGKKKIVENKFEEQEKIMSEAENILLEAGKYVSVNPEENHMIHNDTHEKAGDSMLIKRHMKSHCEMMESCIKSQMHEMEVETAMNY